MDNYMDPFMGIRVKDFTSPPLAKGIYILNGRKILIK